MSSLRSLIRDTKAAKKDLVATTIRIPKELNSVVIELGEQLSLSKQEILLKLIEEGMTIAQDELNLDVIDDLAEPCNFHLLNTNKRHSIDDHERMIKDGSAAAFYDPWKHNIDRIKEHDIVFLYENGVGIVAYGKGTGKVLKRDHDGKPDECYYQELQEFKVLDDPLSARQIKKILNRNVVFLKTMSDMSDGQKLIDIL